MPVPDAPPQPTGDALNRRVGAPRYARRAHISSRGDRPYGCAWCLPAGRSVVPVRELGAHRLPVAISGTRPAAQAPAGRSPMALPEAGSGQLPRVQLNGSAAARPGCARLRHGANHARPADELARAARPRRYGGAADAQHRLSKRAPRTSPLTRDRLCVCPSARVSAQAHQAGIGTASPAARPGRGLIACKYGKRQARIRRTADAGTPSGPNGHHGEGQRTHPGHGAASRLGSANPRPLPAATAARESPTRGSARVVMRSRLLYFAAVPRLRVFELYL